MKQRLYIERLFFIGLLLFTTQMAQAKIIYRPESFAGRIISPVPGIVCTTAGSAYIVIGTQIPPLPIIDLPGSTKKIGRAVLAPSKRIIGQIKLVPNMSDCYIPGTPPIPFPTSEIKMYSTS